MSKEVMLFDIDGTLIDSKSMADFFCREISRQTGISFDEVIRLRIEYISSLASTTDYHPNDLVNFISKDKKVEIDASEIFFKTKSIYERYIFGDAVEILNRVKNDYSLGVFSEGFVDYQNQKIGTLIDFFDEDLMIIERRKLSPESVKKIPNGATLIDDRKEVIETLANTRPDLNLIWINRKDNEKLNTPKIRTIKSLDELLTI